jgi:hypothetical protein
MSTFRRKLTFCRTGSKSPLTGRIGSRAFGKTDEAGWPRARGSERGQPVTTTSTHHGRCANGSDQETTSRSVTAEGEVPRLERLGLRIVRAPGVTGRDHSGAL